MVDKVEKLCKKVSLKPATALGTDAICENNFYRFVVCDWFTCSVCVCVCVCPQVHVQVVDIFDNADVVMSKFIQSLLERVLQVQYHPIYTWHLSLSPIHYYIIIM